MARTELKRLITEKWILPLETFAERSGVYPITLKRVLRGEEIGDRSAANLRKFLENYKGEEG